MQKTKKKVQSGSLSNHATSSIIVFQEQHEICSYVPGHEQPSLVNANCRQQRGMNGRDDVGYTLPSMISSLGASLL